MFHGAFSNGTALLNRHSDFSNGEGVAEPMESNALTVCCKDLATALTFPAGRHFFVENGQLKLLVARTPMQGGGEADLENVIRFCPFCGTPLADMFKRSRR